MREFIRRALQKTSRMNSEQMQSLLSLVTEEYELLDAVLDSLSTGVIVCDSFHIMVQSNKAAARILPMDTYESQERAVWTTIRDPEIAFFVAQTIEAEDTVMAREFSIQDGLNSRYVSISVMPLVRSKSVRGTIITIEDITSKKNEELKSRRLESLASLTNLAATVAHEIKNPLGSISIYVQLLRKTLNKIGVTAEGEAQSYLDVVDEEIERLNKIVVDFLFAVRPFNFEFAPLDLNALVSSLVDFFSTECEQSGITLTVETDQSLPLINGDERFLRQVFTNLIKNSMNALPDGGVIRFTTSHTDEMVTVKVSDSGTGIPAQVISRIFEPYFTTKVDGTGLGLTMAYKVIKEHSGDIRVQSQPELGTTFTVDLPVLRKARKMIEYEERQ